MAKYRRYRKYTRHRARWSPNIQQISTTTVQATTGTFHYSYALCTTTQQTPGQITQAYTAKNFEVNMYIDSFDQASAIHVEDVCAYIMYRPEGVTLGINTPFTHPEWIMAYKYLGSPSTELSNTSAQGQQYQPIRIRSRMARKLQSGDSIYLLIVGNNTHTSSMSFDIHGLIRWWTKAN